MAAHVDIRGWAFDHEALICKTQPDQQPAAVFVA